MCKNNGLVFFPAIPLDNTIFFMVASSTRTLCYLFAIYSNLVNFAQFLIFSPLYATAGKCQHCTVFKNLQYSTGFMYWKSDILHDKTLFAITINVTYQ